MKKHNNPVVHSSHKKEWQSKLEFEKLLHEAGMFLPNQWAQKDYGIDATVEVTRPSGGQKDMESRGQFFLVQLKSTNKVKISGDSISYSLPTDKITYWLTCNLPVMFVLNDLSVNRFYHIWINPALLNTLSKKNPLWMNQQTITVRIPTSSLLTATCQVAVWEYVTGWKAAAIPLTPGVYFQTKTTSEEWLIRCRELTKGFTFDSVRNNLGELTHKLNSALYKIAITGPSRVGKSTLVNALLKRNISPTDIYQTTGVPIQIYPGRKDCVEVYFNDGRKEQYELSEGVIKSFATQQENEGNTKSVALVTVYLRNTELEKGVSYIDIPGLDDADEGIFQYAWTTVCQANAVLYLVDASSFEHGGYVFRREFKNHILSLGQSLDKIFLVFNKCNVLTGDKRALLRARVEQDLKKYGLFEKVAGKVHFISAEERLNARKPAASGVIDDVSQLEKDLWHFILNENKNGLAQLHHVAVELEKCVSQCSQLISVSLLNEESRSQLVTAMEQVQKKVESLAGYFGRQKELIIKTIKVTLENSLQQKNQQLKRNLEAIPGEQPLPDHNAIRRLLIQYCEETLQETNKVYIHEIMALQKSMYDWIQEHLKEVHSIIAGGGEQKTISFTELELLEPVPVEIDMLLKTSLVTGTLTYFFFPAAAIVAGIATLFGGLWFSAEERRAKRIKQIVEKAGERMAKQYEKNFQAYLEVMEESCHSIANYVDNNISVYLIDMQNQLNNIPQLTAEEQNQMENALQVIPEFRQGLTAFINEIHQLVGRKIS